MITESGIQPLLALIFLAGGGVSYIPMIIIGWLPMGKRLPVLKHIAEGVWGLFFCLVFLGLSHLVYDGQIKYFTVLCYLGGGVASSLFLKLPVETLIRKLNKIKNKEKQSPTANHKK